MVVTYLLYFKGWIYSLRRKYFKQGDFMKFLIALSVLVSASAFAQGQSDIHCYEQGQGDNNVPAYTFRTAGNSIHLDYPSGVNGNLQNEGECLIKNGDDNLVGSRPRFAACLSEGQRIGTKIPVDIFRWNQFFETVYCEETLEPWFDR
jgi:hypothetical protein